MHSRKFTMTSSVIGFPVSVAVSVEINRKDSLSEGPLYINNYRKMGKARDEGRNKQLYEYQMKGINIAMY